MQRCSMAWNCDIALQLLPETPRKHVCVGKEGWREKVRDLLEEYERHNMTAASYLNCQSSLESAL